MLALVYTQPNNSDELSTAPQILDYTSILMNRLQPSRSVLLFLLFCTLEGERALATLGAVHEHTQSS